jgi:glycosyltransferase involved in cell wall biosynthesis
VPVPYPKEPYPVLATVVIPVLNRAKFIGNAIERVLEGTFKDFEVVVVDNGSTDGTQDVVRSYAEKDPRVRLVQENGPCIAYALNKGIKAARGKYICQLDSDDEYTKDTLEKMTAHLESHPKAGLAISYYELMDENRVKVEGVDPVTHSGYTRNQILRRDGAGALRVFPKVVLEEMGYYDEENFGNFGEDYDMVLKVGEKYDVDRVHHVLYRYRRHADNTDVTRDPLMKIRNKNNARLNALRRRQEINKKLGKV